MIMKRGTVCNGCGDPAHPEDRPDIPDVCPSCGARHSLGPWGGYKRGLVYVTGTLYGADDALEVNEGRVVIDRVRCKECKKTHALFSHGIVPYSPYSARTLMVACVLLRTLPKASEAAKRVHAALVTLRRAWADAVRLAEALACAIDGLPAELERASADAASVADLCARFADLHGTTPFSRTPLPGWRPEAPT